MNTFEFFSLIFLVLNNEWQDCKDEDLGQFLSEMNPYFWQTEDSADPAVYSEFKEFMKDKSIGEDYGYSLVNDYLDTIYYFKNLRKFFSVIDKEYWIESARCLLNQPHKGQSTNSMGDGIC